MSEPASAAPTLEELLERLEAALGRMSDGSAALDQLVAAHEEAGRLLVAAEVRFAELNEWARRLEIEA